MAQPVLAETLLSIIADLERRLVALERSPQLTSASIKDGALTINNAAGQPIIVLGKQADDLYGLRVNNAAGTEVSRLGDLGSGLYGLRVSDSAGTEVLRSTSHVTVARFSLAVTAFLSSSSYQDVTGATDLTFTKVRNDSAITLSGSATSYSAVSSSKLNYALRLNGVDHEAGQLLYTSTFQGYAVPLLTSPITGLPAGVHTVRLRWKGTDLGSGIDFRMSNQDQYILQAEEI